MSSQLVPQDIVPISAGYVILMAVLAAGLRLDRRAPPGELPTPERARAGDLADGARGRSPSRFARQFPVGWPRLAAHVIGTAAGGYVLLMAIVVLYYYGVARVANQFLESAFTGSALLLAVALPCFGILSWLAQHRRRRARSAADSGSGGNQRKDA